MAWLRVEEGIFRFVDKAGVAGELLTVKVSVRGQPKWVGTGSSDIRVARKKRAELLTDGARGDAITSGRMTVGKLLDALEANDRLHDKLTPTRATYLQLFRDELGAMHPSDLVREDDDRIEALQLRWKRDGWVDAMGKRRRLTNGTINRRCNVLRAALRFGMKKGRIRTAPLIGRLSEKGAVRGKEIPPGLAQKFADALAPYWRPLFWFAYAVGTRRGQLSRTKRADVDLERGVIDWHASETKGEAAHTMPIPADVRAIVVEALRLSPINGCPYLFHAPRCLAGNPLRVSTSKRAAKWGGAEFGCIGDIKSAIARACLELGFPTTRKAGGYVFHSTRHSAATNMHAGGMAVADIKAFTGHKSTKVLEDTYTHARVDLLAARHAAAMAEVERQTAARGALEAPKATPATSDGKRRRTARGRAAGLLRAVEDGRKTVEMTGPATTGRKVSR